MSPLPALPPHWVTFYERDAPRKQLSARLGDSPPTPDGSGGGSVTGDWNLVTLPKRSAVTIWQGRANLLMLGVPIVLGDADGSELAVGATTLARMHRPQQSTVEPPVVNVRAPGTIVPYQNLDYVISDLVWGDTITDENAGRVLQKLTVMLLEFRDDEPLQARKAKKPKHHGRTYTVKSGDTLTSIAKRFKVKGGWRTVGDAQHPPIHDPRNIHVGQRLLIP